MRDLDDFKDMDAGKAALAAATPEQIEALDAVLAHAARHYEEDGWDLLVETWDRWEVFKALGEHDFDVDRTIKALADELKPVADYRADIQAEADY